MVYRKELVIWLHETSHEAILIYFLFKTMCHGILLLDSIISTTWFSLQFTVYSLSQSSAYPTGLMSFIIVVTLQHVILAGKIGLLLYLFWQWSP